jgi:hypothetical protein
MAVTLMTATGSQSSKIQPSEDWDFLDRKLLQITVK